MIHDAHAKLLSTPEELSACAASLAVIVPALADVAPSERDIVAMLPVVDINGVLMRKAADFKPLMGTDHAAHRTCAGVLAVDPFLVFDDLVAALRAGGFAAVVNFPSVGLLDGTTGAGLAAVGYDLAAELKLLKRLESEGFAVRACVTHAEAARTALAAGFNNLLFHPAFRGPAEARATLAAVRAAAGAQMVGGHVEDGQMEDWQAGDEQRAGRQGMAARACVTVLGDSQWLDGGHDPENRPC